MNPGSSTIERTPPQLAPGAPLVRMTLTGAEGEQSVETLGPVTLIGSRKDCHLPISNTEVSKVHCAICNTGREIIACDLRSRTGTFVNDAQINSAVLRPGDRLRIGNVEIALTFVRQAAPAPPGEASDGPRTDAVRFKLPLHVNGVGKDRALTTQPVLIGKRSNCEVFLDTPDVSLAHALIFTVDERPILCDLGSRSGTLLNGQRVSTAYLRDGDTLNVGGEALAIGWKGPVFDEQPAAETPAPQPAPVRTADVNAAASAAAGAVLTMATGGGDDFTNEAAVIANVFSAVKKQRGELERRQVDLDRREGDLDKLALSICDERVLLEQAQGELAQERQKFDTELKSIDTQRAEIEAGREAMNNTLASIQARESALEQRRTEIETRERDLVARAEQLEEQESDVFALVRQVADAQLALEQALGRLQDATKAAEAAAGARPFRKKAPPEAATPRADAKTNGAAQHNGSHHAPPDAPQVITVDNGPLPAPVVDQPIFDGAAAMAAVADLPPYVQERLKVLRRVSRKSEQELLAQVRAEHQTREAAVTQAAETGKSGKAKRRWFS